MRPGFTELRLSFTISKREEKRVLDLMAAQNISRAEAGRRFFQLGLRSRSTKRTSIVGKELSSPCPVSSHS